MIMIIKQKIKLCVQNYFLKKNNPGSMVKLANCFNPKRLTVGIGTYGDIRVISYNTVSKLIIGNYCSIAQDVKFFLDADHNINTISSYPFKVKVLGTENFEAFGKGDIIIKDDVWIGYGASIMSGITVGQGAVIAAGSIVTKDVPPYAIVGGAPARILKFRFEEQIIQELLNCDFSKLNKNLIEKHCNDLYLPINCKADLSWFKSITKKEEN